jgi:hypothetical protein
MVVETDEGLDLTFSRRVVVLSFETRFNNSRLQDSLHMKKALDDNSRVKGDPSSINWLT